MSGILAGLRVTEVSAFIAAPLGGMTLAQLGAEVIRIDPLGGNMDYARWPLTPEGISIYWRSLNKAKRSVTLALDKPQGQELARAIICAPGPGAGIVLSNLPAKGWMEYQTLRRSRDDLILARLTGNYDGSTAVDYTVNSASGFPLITGQGTEPVNHVLPAWDIAAGLYLAVGLLSAERQRVLHGRGQEITLALSDVMLATLGNLGYLADAQINGAAREPLGNYLYGDFGRDFATADGRRVMVVVLSHRQWTALGRATGMADKLSALGALLEIDLTTEGGRYQARAAIAGVLEPWFAARTLSAIEQAFKGTGALWGPYRSVQQLLAEDSRCSLANPLFGEIDQPGVGRILAP